MKRFWDTNYPGHPYDPVARRRGQSTETPASLAPIASRPAASPAVAAGVRSGGKTPIGGHRAGSSSAVNHEQVLGLQAQLKEMSAHLEGLEKERDFYFAKVRFLEAVGMFASCLFHSYAISRSWCNNRLRTSQRRVARMQRSWTSRKFSIPLRCVAPFISFFSYHSIV